MSTDSFQVYTLRLEREARAAWKVKWRRSRFAEAWVRWRILLYSNLANDFARNAILPASRKDRGVHRALAEAL